VCIILLAACFSGILLVVKEIKQDSTLTLRAFWIGICL
jgi:hypothetical protein